MYKIELRDVRSLLCKKFGDDNLVLVNCSVSPLLEIGENYGSTILKVQVLVKRSGKELEEEINLVAKMLPSTDFQRNIFDSSFTFKKEIYFYEELIPAYQRLEREFGVKYAEIIDVVPELYGVRYSLIPDADVDDDAVILMQNLMVDDYYTADRRNGLDLEHAKVAVTALARFHALGMAMKHHNPEFFDILKVRAKCLEFKNGEDFSDARMFYIRTMCNDPEMSVHSKPIKVAMTQETATTWSTLPPEPWSTIVHSDFWINNIMYRKDPVANRIIDIKFVDFQNYLCLSPLRELTFFLLANTNVEVMEYKLNELLDCYYQNFIDVLVKMKCSVEAFSRDKFDERLKIDAFEEFPHIPFMIRTMTVKANENLTIEENMKNETVAELMLKRLRTCVKKYAEKGWFDMGLK